MKIRMLPEGKETELTGPLSVAVILRRLGLIPGTVMVIRADELLTDDAMVAEDDVLEIRRVISGGTGAEPGRVGP